MTWTPERHVRYLRSKNRGSLSWMCILCNNPIKSNECPHSIRAHEEAVAEHRVADVVYRVMCAGTGKEAK